MTETTYEEYRRAIAAQIESISSPIDSLSFGFFTLLLGLFVTFWVVVKTVDLSPNDKNLFGNNILDAGQDVVHAPRVRVDGIAMCDVQLGLANVKGLFREHPIHARR